MRSCIAFGLYGVGRLMNTQRVVLEIPEKILLAEKTTADAFGREMQILSAVKLYELGRLSSGRAAELAGMGRVEFLSTLGKYKVFPLLAELEEMEEASERSN